MISGIDEVDEAGSEARVVPWSVLDGPATVTRTVAASLVVLSVLFLAALFMDDRGYLGTDTGGKVATLEAMADRTLGLDPDLGYWASRWDPEGQLHGMYYTTEVEGRYVNVTTLPMLELGAPLYRLGGYRLALILPMVGALAAAWASFALARRLGAVESRAWLTFWIVAFASPLTLYALDFWEHAPGVGLVAWAIVVLVDVVDRRHRSGWALLAGLLFGAAFTMRTEATIYAFVATGLACLVLLRHRRVVESVVAGASSIAGFGLVVLANAGLERLAFGGGLRTGRAAGTAQAGGDEIVTRLQEALATAAGLRSGLGRSELLLAAVAGLVLLVAVVVAMRRRQGPALRILVAVLVALLVFRLAAGPGFVPGLLMVWPIAAVGAVAWTKRPTAFVEGYLVGVGLLALPLVWAFQYIGGAGPQWGGRYILVSGLLLTVVGVSRLGVLPLWFARVLVCWALAVSLLGVAWLSIRSHEVADAAEVVSGLSEPVVISTSPFWLRELGAEYDGQRWLSVATRAELDDAVEIVGEAGFESFALLDTTGRTDPPDIDGYAPTSTASYGWLDGEFRISRYERLVP